MSDIEFNLESMKSEYRKFGILVGCIFGGVFGLLIPYLKHGDLNIWFIMVGGILILLGSIFPLSLKYFYIVWMKIGEILGWINSRIILGFVFYFLITPIGVLKKIFGTDSMQRSFSKKLQSYRIQSEARSPKEMEKPF
ncbi:MAG: SxtJ family membrane protein [Leptospiraceae bacterium]|nr:hypothetical protein [Leptospiraceae bacterium]MCK6380606.1 SxtJ family membrane protein [Leptospiraceae bacterium]NUM41961.1 hypothetical protein [Leptospiraceae bacterium]